MLTDTELLQRYVAEKSEAAFRELVTRHLPLVYSAALRQLAGDAHLAQDVAQSVFIALARKAASLTTHASLTGWLYLGTHHAAAQAVRGNRRRIAREQEAHAMQTRLLPETSVADWERVRPVLDDAMRELNDADRDAVLLRYFEQRPFAEIGAALHVNEDAARMRVERALDKLHALLAKRGIRSTAAAFGLTLQSHVAAAVPAGLAASITHGAVATAASGWLAALGSNLATSTVATVAAAVSVGAALLQQRERREADMVLQHVASERTAAVARVRNLSATLERAEREADAVATPASTTSSGGTAGAATASSSDPRLQVGKEFLAAHPEAQALIDAVMRGFGGTSARALALRNLGLSPDEWQRAELELARSTTAAISIGNFSFSVGPETDPRAPAGNRLATLLGDARYEQFTQQEAALRAKSVVQSFATAAWDSDLALSPEQATALGALVDANRRMKTKTDRAVIYETDWPAVADHAGDVLSPAQLAVFKTLVARDGGARQSVPVTAR